MGLEELSHSDKMPMPITAKALPHRRLGMRLLVKRGSDGHPGSRPGAKTVADVAASPGRKQVPRGIAYMLGSTVMFAGGNAAVGPRRKTGQDDCRTGKPIGDSRGRWARARSVPTGRSNRPVRLAGECARMSPVEARRQRPGFSAGVGTGRQVGRDAPSPTTSLRGDAASALG